MSKAMKLSNLPREIEEEILSRVPVKALRLLRSTGKRWYHHLLFKDPRFIKRHFETRAAREYHEAIVLVDFRILSMNSYVDRERYVSQFVLIDPVSNQEVDIAHAFHCDGILLCTSTKDKRFVAWNPFSGKTRWIQPRENGMSSCKIYALGYDNKELCRSYKVLRSLEDQTVEIYEFKSDSWRNLDGVSPGGSFESLGVSLKGNAYWISRRGGAKEYSLLEFDFSTERFQNLYLPFHEAECLGPHALREGLNGVALSVIREERLCLLYESAAESKTEIWKSSEINETASVTWCKFLTLDTAPKFSSHLSFFIDEEEKRTTCFYNHGHVCKVNMVAENGERLFGWYPRTQCGPIVFGYVPKIQQCKLSL